MGFLANVEDYIPLEKCKHSGLYKIYARNFSLGVYHEKDKGFIGVRKKFHMVYLFTEIHWDADKTYGTVKPIEFLEWCPVFVSEHNERLLEWLKERNEHYL
jgi:hypothetical protein